MKLTSHQILASMSDKTVCNQSKRQFCSLNYGDVTVMKSNSLSKVAGFILLVTD